MTPEEAVKILDANIKLLGENEMGIGFHVSVEISQGVFDYINNLITGKAPEVAEVGIQFRWRGVNCIVT